MTASNSALTHADGRPFGMPRKQYALLLDRERFADWVAEQGGDAGLLQFVKAQVASGVTLKTLCEHYVLDYGLLWDWVSAESVRLEQYYLAQRGVSEYYVAETVTIADEGEDVARDKLRIDTRLKVASKWNRERYGDADAQLGAGLENLAAVLTRISERKQRAMAAPEIEDAEVIPAAIPDKPVLAPVRGIAVMPGILSQRMPIGMLTPQPFGALAQGYGNRLDGTPKGNGYFGPIKRPDGDVSTELSFDFDQDGRNIAAPLLVPTLSIDEINHLLSGAKPTDSIYDKAQNHALERIKAGKPTWALPDEIYPIPGAK